MVRTPVRSIVGAVASAAARWSDPRFEQRRRAREAVCERTGYPAGAVDYAFDRLFGSMRADSVAAVIESELGSLQILDDFVTMPGRPPVRALPVGRVCVIASRTTIGVAIVPAVFALCAKCTVLVKDREDYLTSSFFSSVAEQLAWLGDRMHAAPWDGTSLASGLHEYDAVAAFGSDESLAQIAAQLQPSARFIAYGTKAGGGYVTRAALGNESAAREIARAAAIDLLLYETEGCMSLHALFVERGGGVSVERFAAILSEAIEELTPRFPPARHAARTLERVAAARELAAFRGGPASLHGDDASYFVTVDPPAEEPPLFLPRVLSLRSVDAPPDARRYLRSHGVALEVLAVAERRDDLVELAIDVGAARLTRFGAMQAPPLGAFHGGRPRIAEFVRWMCDET